MRIYELLGVNIFRKYILFTCEKIFKSINIDVGYRIKKLNIEGVINYKKYIIGFTITHSILLLDIFVQCIIYHKALSDFLYSILLQSYCIMTQRYNYIRMKQLIKRLTPKYERQKDEIKKELKKEDSKLLDHTYKIVDKKERETNISFDDLIANASIEQLKQYRENLAHFQSINQSMQENDFYPAEYQVQVQVDVSIPMKKNKSLKIEFKPKKHNNDATN